MFEKIIARLTRMIKMDHTVYDEIAVDEDATIEAAIIVAITALLAALGTLFVSNFGEFILTFLQQIAIGWVLWSAIVWVVGTKIFAGNGTFMHILRVLGYVTAPWCWASYPSSAPWSVGSSRWCWPSLPSARPWT